MRQSAAVRFAVFLPVLVASDQDPGWNLLATTVEASIPRTCLSAPNLPDYVSGKYIVSGPAQFELNEYKFQGLFDGFAKTNKFEIGHGKVCFTADWLNTSVRRMSFEKGAPIGMMFEEPVPPRPSCPFLDPLCNMKVPPDNDWVNVIQSGGKTLMLTDALQMLEMDIDTLQAKGPVPWADDVKPIGGFGGLVPSWVQTAHMATSGSAHPVQRPGSNEWVDIVSVLGPVPGIQDSFLDVFTFPDALGPQNRTLIASIALPNLPYVHSFGVTPNYVVLPINHKMSTPNMLHPLLLGKIEEHWTGVHIIDSANKVHLFAADFTTLDKMFYHVHIVNSFENATGVTLDVGAFESTPFAKTAQLDIGMFKNKTSRDSNPVRNQIRRLHFHFSGPLQGQTTVQDFQHDSSHNDFFQVSPAHVGLPYCYFYATEWWYNSTDFADMAIRKHDVCNDKRVYWSRPDTYPGEPFFIPSESGQEDDGVVVFVALDGRKGKSLFVMLDGKTMEELEVVELPGIIPFTAHGNFFPDAKSAIAAVIV